MQLKNTKYCNTTMICSTNVSDKYNLSYRCTQLETHQDIEQIFPLEEYSCQEAVSVHSQSSGGLVSSVDEGSSIASSGIASSDSRGNNRGILDMASDSSIDSMTRVGHNSRGLGLLDNGLTGNSNRDRDIVWGINMDRCGHRDNVILVDRGIIRDGNLTLNKDWGLDIVDLNLFLDDGGIVSKRSLEDSWDSNRQMRGGRLQDSGVIARDIVGLSKVNLLGDDWFRLVNSGNSGSLGNSCVRGRGSRCNIRSLGKGGDITSNQTMSSRGRSIALGGYWSSSIGSNTQRGGSQSRGGIGRGTMSHGQEKGKSDERSHIAS